jgi:hypothetical protein
VYNSREERERLKRIKKLSRLQYFFWDLKIEVRQTTDGKMSSAFDMINQTLQ